MSRGNFNPPAPCGAGRPRAARKRRKSNFNPPAPCGAGPGAAQLLWQMAHFNPPAPCGAGPVSPPRFSLPGHFNPPAPCGAGLQPMGDSPARLDISIHPPLAGRDGGISALHFWQWFQSTRPLRGGTFPYSVSMFGSSISIHPPLAGRDSDLAQKNCAKHRILHKKCIYPGRIERFSGFDAAIFLPNVHKFRCEPSEESLLTPRSHAYTIRTPSG